MIIEKDNRITNKRLIIETWRDKPMKWISLSSICSTSCNLVVSSQAKTVNNSPNWRCSLLGQSPALDTYGFTGCACRCRIFNPFTQQWGMTLTCATEGISMLWICMPNEPTLGELQQTSTESTKLWPCCPFYHQRRPFEYQYKSK